MPFDPNQQLNRCLAAITAINLDTNTYAGYSKQVGQIEIRSAIQPGGHLTIPAVGEQWMLQKVSGVWYLQDKTDWLDARVSAIPNEEGLDVFGTMNGPTYLTGSRVELPSEVVLGGHRIRLNPATNVMETHDGSTWIPVVPAPAPYVPPAAETRDEPTIFRISGATSVPPSGAFTQIPLSRIDGNDDYTADGAGRVVLPYTGWYAVGAQVSASTWSGGSPAFDASTSGWVTAVVDRYDAGVVNQLRLARNVEPKVGSTPPMYSFANPAFKGTAGQLVGLRVAEYTSNNSTLNFVTADQTQVTLRWFREL